MRTGSGVRQRAAVVAPAGERVTLLGLKAHCAAHLPKYMVVDT